MKFSKTAFTILLIIFGVNFIDINAQDEKSPKPKQIKILNNYGHIPFEDGETTIAEVVFIGLDSDYEKYDETLGRPVPKSKVLNAIKEQRTNIIAGDKFYGYKVSKVVKILREILSANGYINPKVVAFGEMLPKNKMNLVFSVKRGLPAFVSEIRFEDIRNFTNEELVGILKPCLRGKKVFDARHYEYCLQKDVRNFIFSKGYFQARIEQVTPRLVANSYILEIPVTEGVRFVYGSIEFKGASIFSEKQLFEMFGLKTGDVANGKYLQDFVFEKLKKEYGNRGYVLYDAEFVPTFIIPQAEGLDGIVNLIIDIDEGRQFKVESIDFSGIEKEEKIRLIKLLDIEEGEIYNHSKLEEGIKKINELIEFAPIDMDQHVESRTTRFNDGILAIADDGTAIIQSETTIQKRKLEIEQMNLAPRIKLIIRTRKLNEDEREYYRELSKRLN